MIAHIKWPLCLYHFEEQREMHSGIQYRLPAGSTQWEHANIAPMCIILSAESEVQNSLESTSNNKLS